MDHRLADALRGRYELEREVGAGGMATVWLAHDLRHHRHVAVKVLHPHLAAVLGAERFLKEIRTTAQLQHPHILPLFDSGEADGLLYYVMPYIEGESLRERITRETRLSVPEAVRIGAEVASALDYAHRHGVIHRDIKPENILLHEGRALVSDFGIALAPTEGSAQRITETGISLGTPAYMSPEQALGERTLDARSDVYAAGALVYEMLTGAPPFTGGSAQAIVAKVITGTPVAPSKVRRDVPGYVSDAVLMALQKNPASRFASGAALQAALEGKAPSFIRSRRSVVVKISVWAVALAAVLGAALVYATSQRDLAAAPSPLSIAAVPFQFDDSADAYLGDQIPVEILDALTHVSALTVRPLAAAPRFRNNSDLGAIARELEVSTLLTGTVTRQGNALRVTARLYDVPRNQNLPTVSFTNSATNKFAIEDSLSAHILASLKLTPDDAQIAADVALSRAGRTEMPAAHDSLMLARFYAEQRTPAGLTRAIAMFQATIRLDSNYAEAWAGLANALGLRAVFGDSSPELYLPAAKANVLHAIHLDSASAYAHSTYGFIKVFYDRDYVTSGAEFSRALALDSTQSATWLFRAWYLLGAGRLDSALESVRHAWRIDPASLIAGTREGQLLNYSDSLVAAERQLQAVLRIDKNFQPAQLELALVFAEDHNCESARAMISQVALAPQRSQFFPAYRAAVLGGCGDLTSAKRELDQIEAGAKEGKYINPFFVAVAYASIGDRAGSYRWIDNAIETNDWALFYLRVHPAFRSYRDDPEFRRLLKRARLL